MSSDLRKGRHVVYDLIVHLVFVTKYRREVLNKEAMTILVKAWQTVCREFGCELMESNGEADHVHLLVAYPPKVSVSVLVNSLKGVSARRLRAAHLSSVEQVLWGEHFWSPSYGAFSTGGAGLDRVKQYIEQQGEKAPKGRSGSSEGPLPLRRERRSPRGLIKTVHVFRWTTALAMLLAA